MICRTLYALLIVVALGLPAPAPAQLLTYGGQLALSGSTLATPALTGISYSASANTIYAAWSTSAATPTTLACGTVAGAYTLTDAWAGSQTSVTSHSGIVANLSPATLYYCSATSDGINYTYFSITTLTSPTSTPLVSATWGSAINPVPNQNKGDTYSNCQADDGNIYVGTDDSTGWGNGQSAAMMYGKFTSLSPLTGTNVNLMSNLGSSGGAHKQFGMYCYNKILYGNFAVQTYVGNPPGVATDTYGSIIKSVDHGSTWASWNAPTTYNANGTVPTGTMFDGGASNITLFAVTTFVSYAPDNGLTLTTERVDDGDAYAYMISTDTNWNNGSNLYLARIPLGYLPSLSASKVQYYTGGGSDGNMAANWSTSISGATPILTAANEISATSVQYMPSTGRYVMVEWYYPDPATLSSTVIVVYEAPHPWGPTWTQISSTASNPQGFYNPNILQPTGVAATPNGTPMSTIMAGDYAGGGTGPYYQLWEMSLTLNTH